MGPASVAENRAVGVRTGSVRRPQFCNPPSWYPTRHPQRFPFPPLYLVRALLGFGLLTKLVCPGLHNVARLPSRLGRGQPSDWSRTSAWPNYGCPMRSGSESNCRCRANVPSRLGLTVSFRARGIHGDSLRAENRFPPGNFFPRNRTTRLSTTSRRITSGRAMPSLANWPRPIRGEEL
jgi:hypothetical protein